jgi:hypothetical protein
MTAPHVKPQGLFFYIVGAPGGAFYAFPWPTRADADEMLRAVLAQAESAAP